MRAMFIPDLIISFSISTEREAGPATRTRTFSSCQQDSSINIATVLNIKKYRLDVLMHG